MEFKKVLMVSSAAVALAASSSAQAGDYFTVFGGATFQSGIEGSQSFSATHSGVTHILGAGSYYQFSSMSAHFSQELESGFVLGGAYGRNFNQFWRGELELAYRENAVDSPMAVQSSGVYGRIGGGVTYIDIYQFTTSTPVKSTIPSFGSFYNVSPGNYSSVVPSDGSTSFFSIMANVWYDFNIAGPWETFIGAGIGMAQANVNSVTAHISGPPGGGSRVVPGLVHLHAPITGTTAHTGTHIPFAQYSSYATLLTDPVIEADGSDWVFAYQFGVGAGYNLDNGVRLSAQYRYFGTDEAEIDGVALQGEASEFLFGISFPLGN